MDGAAYREASRVAREAAGAENTSETQRLLAAKFLRATPEQIDRMGHEMQVVVSGRTRTLSEAKIFLFQTLVKDIKKQRRKTTVGLQVVGNVMGLDP